MMGRGPSKDMMEKMFMSMSEDPGMRKFMAQRMLHMVTDHPEEFRAILDEEPELKEKLKELLK